MLQMNGSAGNRNSYQSYDRFCEISNNLLEGLKTRVSISCHLKPTCKPTGNSTCIFKRSSEEAPKRQGCSSNKIKYIPFDNQPAESLVSLLRYESDPSVFLPSFNT